MAKSPTQDSVPDEFLECRTIGHAWNKNYNSTYVPRYGDVNHCMHFRCLRCHTERHDVFTRYGRINYRHYQYPEGYSVPADETPTRDELRIRYFEDIYA